MILEPGRNAWRIEPADRVAVLVDAGRYFGALRQALLRAQSTVFIVGWDFDSRTRLVGESGVADDGLPEAFIDFLSVLVERQPKLRVHVLIWDYSVLYALERELFPSYLLHWKLPRQIRYCLDDDLPLGASHHQKIVVIDDAIAFVGGLDITIRRWDTTAHRPDDQRRIDPAGAPYAPFHDVQALVDGRAAYALAELVRMRWSRGACERPTPIHPTGDPWPKNTPVDFTGVQVAIARSLPACDQQEEVREVEALFLDAINQAEETIYIENQFVTAPRLAEHLARRMLENPRLEAILILPKTHRSWVEAQVMLAGRIRFHRVLQDAGVAERLALLFPQVSDGCHTTETMVHSKVMIVDDVLLRVGSANLNNRSISIDTECDLAIEATAPEHRRAIRRIRHSLIGHHCGSDTEEVAAAIERTGSVIEAVRALNGNGHSLQPVRDCSQGLREWPLLQSIADPEQPILAPAFVQTFVGQRPPARRFSRFAKAIAVGVMVIALVLSWRLTPLGGLTDPQTIADLLSRMAERPESPILVIATFIAAGLFAFPVTLLIALTAATFGPWLGSVYAAVGALASATVGYGIGALIGQRVLEDLIGPKLNRIRRSIAQRGVFAVAAIRLVPIAPFTLVNLSAGAARIPFADYVLGTFIGMAPGLVLLSALGYQVLNIITAPTWTNMTLFVLAVFGWVAITIGVQAVLLRTRRRKT